MNRVVFLVGRRGPGLKLFPVMLALVLIVFGLLTFLVVLQDRTIDAQRDVIHLLYKDRGRPAVKPSAGQIHTSQPTKVQAPATQNPSAQVQSDKTPSEQVQSSQIQTPSSQVPLSEKAAETPASQQKKSMTKPSHSARKSHKAPSPPPAEITDPSDMRRVSISI